MSIHIYSPLSKAEAKEAIKSTAPQNVEIVEGGGLISFHRTQIRFTIDRILPSDPEHEEGVRSKINFWGHQPLENDKPLQITIGDDEKIAELMRSIISSLNAIDEIQA